VSSTLRARDDVAANAPEGEGVGDEGKKTTVRKLSYEYGPGELADDYLRNGQKIYKTYMPNKLSPLTQARCLQGLKVEGYVDLC
jgi:hypothetical protein